MDYKPYPRTFSNREEAIAYLEERGKLPFFGVNNDFHVYNFHHNNGKKYHLWIYDDGRVTYEEMSAVQYHYWRSQGY